MSLGYYGQHKMAADFYSTLSKTDNVAVSYRNAILGLMSDAFTANVLGTIHFSLERNRYQILLLCYPA